MVSDTRILELARKHLAVHPEATPPLSLATDRDLLAFARALLAEREAAGQRRIGVECVGVGGVRLLEQRPVGVVVDPADRAAVIARGAGREGQVLRACIEDGEG